MTSKTKLTSTTNSTFPIKNEKEKVKEKEREQKTTLLNLNVTFPFLLLMAIRFIIGWIPSYLHPDELMQIPEPAAAWTLQNGANLTWEFQTNSPLRSVLPIYSTTGWVFHLAKLFGFTQPLVLYTLNRTVFILLSIATDAIVYRLSNFDTSLLTWMTFSHAHFYLTHSFSNSSITFLFTVALYCIFVDFEKPFPENKLSYFHTFFLTATSALGVFMHPSFLFFIFPFVFLCLKRFTITSFILGILSASSMACLCIVSDSIFYKGNWKATVFTVYNFLKYNGDPSNLSQHGLHPRYLHLLVNLPFLFGPILFSSTLKNHVFSMFRTVSQVSIISLLQKKSFWLCLSIMFSLFGLSLIPHQEPRFLLPLYPLLFLLLRPQSSRLSYFYFFSGLMFLFLSVHQSGLIPCALFLTSLPPLPIVTWCTYMLPQFLVPFHASYQPIYNLGCVQPFPISSSSFTSSSSLVLDSYYLISPVLPPSLTNITTATSATQQVEWLTSFYSLNLDALNLVLPSKGQFHLYRITTNAS